MYSPSGFSFPPVPTSFIYSDSLLRYKFSPKHPMDPVRLDLTKRLAEELGVFELPNVEMHRPHVASREELETVHDPDYITRVMTTSADPSVTDAARGLGTQDNPAFADMHVAAAMIFGGSVRAAELVADGRAKHVVNFAGGMHHAARGAASGFCIYNDVAGAIARLLEAGFTRVLSIDIDAHHGDGTQAIFENDPRVLTVSLHESGVSLFPGTGFPYETGGPDAPGSAVNIAVPPGTSDAGWLRAFHAVVPQVAAAFKPEVIVSQHGCDSHSDDPLSNLRVSVDAQRMAAISIAGLAHDLCEDRWIATGGGGYDVVGTTPRAWTHLCAVAAGKPISVTEATPDAWRRYVKERCEKDAPAAMGEDVDTWWRSWEVGFDPDDPVDRAIMATRKEALPLHGLDPWFD
ncbi:acetoin utilization protein AcuC [Falsarthrobacter nasiphocae]|uniref:Acetoin utilization protein AcuC n=1 Tax=Falsarthrobacter nasiphocae TaxID=189863 RepID=A0AAE3YHP8_9MICC|nr:acetoin utilization protein AcuC [Falsarthrobacter nasiphocae]MDR6892369.1 acetoin utilization protein AcuC [Falsarthrobacter nasiphocae]